METRLVYSLFIYTAFVWKVKTWANAQVFLRQLPMYYLSAGAAFLARGLLIFPLPQLLGMNYLLSMNTGLPAGAAVNLILSDRYVFTTVLEQSD